MTRTNPHAVVPPLRWRSALLICLCAGGVACATRADKLELEQRLAALEARSSGDLQVQSVQIVDKKGKVHGSFGVRAEDGTPQLLLQDTDGRNRVLLRLHPDGTPILVMWGKEGRGTSYLSVPGEGPPQLMFFDKDGGQPVKLP